jgi:hypothetical protein
MSNNEYQMSDVPDDADPASDMEKIDAPKINTGDLQGSGSLKIQPNRLQLR